MQEQGWTDSLNTKYFTKKCHLYLVGDEISDYFKRFIVFTAQTLMPPSYIMAALRKGGFCKLCLGLMP